jgi:hypothetical protein
MIYINGSTTIHLRIYEHLKIKLTSWLSFQLEFTFITKTILPNSGYLEVFIYRTCEKLKSFMYI